LRAGDIAISDQPLNGLKPVKNFIKCDVFNEQIIDTIFKEKSNIFSALS